MRHTLLTAAALGLALMSGAAHARGFTPPELDRMSQEKLNSGAYRGLGGTPLLQSTTKQDVLHQPSGIWVCMGTGDYQPVLAAPSPNAPQLATAYGRVAVGNTQSTFAPVLLREGKIGYVPVSAIKPYVNKFKPHATCSVAGLRPDGSLVYDVK